MNQQEFLEEHKKICAEMHAISSAKNTDYAQGGHEDAFANFRLVEKFGVASTAQGFFTRMTDKLARIASFIQAETLAVKDESVEDTLQDLANYSILFLLYLRSEREKNAELQGNVRVSVAEDSGINDATSCLASGIQPSQGVLRGSVSGVDNSHGFYSVPSRFSTTLGDPAVSYGESHRGPHPNQGKKNHE